MATADLTYFPDDPLAGAIRRLVTSTAMQEGDSGISGRFGKFDYPLLELTMSLIPDQADDVEDLFFTQNGPERAFLVYAPLARDRIATTQPLLDSDGAPAVGTGSPAVYQTAISKSALNAVGGTLFTKYKPIYHPRLSGLTIYANGVALVNSPALWSLGLLGAVTATATVGQALTWTGTYDTAMHFVNDQLDTTMQASGVEFVKQITIREAPGE